ncbi:DUF3859 domain-containing protein [Photobacterium leiognathi]|uniref:DUF3859 domain-containing protein n=1 Tax=Photobacterium leiognathi TaxID=553611 RepID=UPI00298187D3|nr:DUF3859 domain-containing protein [Photobacterium leiognathi]
MNFRKITMVGLLLSSLAGCSSLSSVDNNVPKVTISEGGVISQNGAVYTVKASNKLVTPKLGQYIGFRYAVEIPDGASDELKGKTAFPITARMTHPKLVNPATQQATTVSTWSDTMYKHDKNLALWQFSEPYELISGSWVFELLYKDQVVAKREFTVANNEQLNQSLKNTFETAFMLNSTRSWLTQNGDALVCDKAKSKRCLQFRSTEECNQTLSRYNSMCQQIALKQMGRGDEITSAKEEMKKYVSYFFYCMHSARINEAKLDKKQVHACLKS